MNITPVSNYNRTKQTPSFKAGLTIKACKGVSGGTNRKTLYHILDKYLEKEFPKHYK